MIGDGNIAQIQGEAIPKFTHGSHLKRLAIIPFGTVMSHNFVIPDLIRDPANVGRGSVHVPIDCAHKAQDDANAPE